MLLRKQIYAGKAAATMKFGRSNSAMELGAQKNGSYPHAMPVNSTEI
jgi:hypothetical protein